MDQDRRGRQRGNRRQSSKPKEGGGAKRAQYDDDSQLKYFPPEGGGRRKSPPKRDRTVRRRSSPPSKITLVKALVSLQYASRGVSLAAIEAGRVTVNDDVVTQLNSEVKQGRDVIAVDGVEIKRKSAEQVTILFHKPRGVAGSREAGQLSLYSFIGSKRSWYVPGGALPRTAGGMVVVSNSDVHANPETSPLALMTSDYMVKVTGQVNETAIREVSKVIASESGVEDGDVKISVDTEGSRATWLLFDRARYGLHDIAAALKEVGAEVLHWKRSRLGPFRDTMLTRGSWRRLTTTEEEALETIVQYGIDDATSPDDVWSAIVDQEKKNKPD